MPSNPAPSLPSTPPPLAPPHGTYPFQPPYAAAPSEPETEVFESDAHRRVTDFAGNSWDLATGGLKTMTAKRQLPPRPERRASEKLPDAAAVQRSLTFAVVILVCVIVMLVSGGIVLFVMLQP
jgi:hypothetical protein